MFSWFLLTPAQSVSVPAPYSYSFLPKSLMATQHTRSPYKGDKQALVIAIDVGTTFSGASYSVLTPNEVPDIVDVTG